MPASNITEITDLKQIFNSVNQVFYKKGEIKTVGAAVTGKAGAVIAGKTYNGQGFSLDPQTVTGALVFVSEDKGCSIVLPYAQIVSSLNAADGDNPAYFQCKVTPCPNTEGIDLFILQAGE